MKNKKIGIFFDLDGTLLDTAPDLYKAMLATLSAFKIPPISFNQFRQYVHNGTKSMLSGCLGIGETHPKFAELCQSFLNYYKDQPHHETDYFPGMREVLDYIDRQKAIWGIITNKPTFLTTPLMQSFGLDQRSNCIISGDTLPQKKPDPTPLLYACQLTQTDPDHSIYIGDAESDITAARAANMTAIAVSYGYHHAENPPENWGADHLINNPAELLSHFKSIIRHP